MQLWFNPFEWYLKTDKLTGVHAMLMAFSYFLNDVIITYGNTESHFPSAQHKHVTSCFAFPHSDIQYFPGFPDSPQS